MRSRIKHTAALLMATATSEGSFRTSTLGGSFHGPFSVSFATSSPSQTDYIQNEKTSRSRRKP